MPAVRFILCRLWDGLAYRDELAKSCVVRKLLAIGPVEISRGSRKTLAIYVHRDQRVEVRAPHYLPSRLIREFVERRSAWIVRQLQKIADKPEPLQLEYCRRARHFYLGREIVLGLVKGARQRAELSDNYLQLCLSKPECANAVKTALLRWYKKQAEVLFARRLEDLHAELNARGFGLRAVNSLKVRKMARSWGNCSQAADIVINLWLVTQQPEYIDYVIVHELCHLLEFNHSARFYKLLDRAMPDWKKAKQALDNSPYPAVD